MKTLFAGVILFVCIGIFSCKKDKHKDSFNDLFKGQTFVGTVNYTGTTWNDPFWIKFNNDNTFTWNEKVNSYPGTYSLNETDRKITLSVSMGATVTIGMKDDVTFGTYQYGSSTPPFTIISGEKYVSENESLVNTKWTSSFIGTVEFISGIEAKISTITMSYTREGPHVHVFYPANGGLTDIQVVLNKGKMKGSAYSITYLFPKTTELTKQ